MNGEVRISPGTAWRSSVVVALVVAVFLLRLEVANPGPVYLIPVLLAAVWFGPVWGGGLGVLCGVLYGVGNELNASGEMAEGVVTSALIRMVLFGVAGVSVGILSRSRERLVERVGKAERELAEMKTIQSTLAPPEPPVRPGLELATCYLPAEEGVAGDFYLVGEGAEDTTVVAIGDVSGRGLEAAKRAWFVRTVLASSAEFTPDPSQLLELANYALIEETGRSESFVTAACLVFHPQERTVRWAVAGHDSPILLDHGDEPPIGARGLPLGIEGRIGCTTSTFSLDPGGGVLLFTDGLTEARSHNGGGKLRLFGLQRVGRLVTELAGESPDRIVDRLRDAAESFAGGSLADDLCIVAARASANPDATSVC